MEGSGDVPDVSSNSTPTVEMVEEEPLNGNFIETVSFCKNIRNVQVLTEAIRGFQGMATLHSSNTQLAHLLLYFQDTGSTISFWTAANYLLSQISKGA